MARVCVSLLVVALASWGCYSVDYPKSYLCSNANSQSSKCPEGFECDGKQCVPRGSKPDGVPPDAPTDAKVDHPMPDGLVPEGPASDLVPKGLKVSVFAGTGVAGHNDGPANLAQFKSPAGIAVAADGTVYVADTNNACIRMIKGGTVSSLAPGNCGATGSGYVLPQGVAVGSDGVYIANTGNNCIKRYSQGSVVEIAGKCGLTKGFLNGSATTAEFFWPTSIAVLASGDILIVDSGNHCIRRYTTGNKQVSTFAGKCTVKGHKDGSATVDALFSSPVTLTASPSGSDVFVGELGGLTGTDGKRIRRVSGGVVMTVAGNGKAGLTDGQGAQAQFDSPAGLLITSMGLFVTDMGTHVLRVIVNGYVTTLSGVGPGDLDGPLGNALFNEPRGLAADSNGKIYVVDSKNHKIRVVEQQ